MPSTSLDRHDKFCTALPPMSGKPLVVFAHGKESGPRGDKIRHLTNIAQKLGAITLSPDYSNLASPDDRVNQLIEMQLPPHGKLLLAGSSMGGYVSLVASGRLKATGLFLMAPALYMPGYLNQNPAPGVNHICIVHGWNDSIIPVDHSFRFAKQVNADLHVIDSDHRLTGSLEYIGALFKMFVRGLL